MKAILRWWGDLVRQPWASLTVGAVLVVTALVELLEEFDDLRAEHGVLLFGVAHILNTLGDLAGEAPELAEAAGSPEPD